MRCFGYIYIARPERPTPERKRAVSRETHLQFVGFFGTIPGQRAADLGRPNGSAKMLPAPSADLSAEPRFYSSRATVAARPRPLHYLEDTGVGVDFKGTGVRSCSVEPSQDAQ